MQKEVLARGSQSDAPAVAEIEESFRGVEYEQKVLDESTAELLKSLDRLAARFSDVLTPEAEVAETTAADGPAKEPSRTFHTALAQRVQQTEHFIGQHRRRVKDANSIVLGILARCQLP